MNLDGTNYKVLHSFASSDGSRPQAGLIAVGSVLYGTAENKVFSLNADGSNFQVIATVADSKAPLLAVGSMLYGTTVGSAAPGQATVFAIAIPEPSSIMLAALGIVSLMAYGWRRKRA
jgi:hypothetical protein